MISEIEKRIWTVLTAGLPIVVTSHKHLDGDALGSGLALTQSLLDTGVEVWQYYHPPIPRMFEFLPGIKNRIGDIKDMPENYNMVVVDCGSLERIGELQECACRANTLINIDHHPTNTEFGDINYVRTDTSSCGELVYGILKAGGVTITPEIAICLYSAILTDTGSFSYDNTTQGAFNIAADLVQAGVEPARVSEAIYFSPPPEVIRLKGKTMSTLQVTPDGKIGTATITREMFQQTATGPEDTEGFADIPLAVKGVEVSALLKDIRMKDGQKKVKISLRSRSLPQSVNVGEVAKSLGGGGHYHAAGCELDGPISVAREKIVRILQARIEHIKR
jgi:phosphoesterase RecJ-like protein